jgi:trigger factor
VGPSQLDDELTNERAGAILKFTDKLPGTDEELSFTVLLKEVQTKKLPPLDADFAKKVGEFDSMEELREDLRTRMSDYKRSLVEEQIRSLALQAFVDAGDLEPPEKLVTSEFEHRLHHVEEDLQRAGLSLAAYAERSGTTELEVRGDLRAQATRSVKAELLLEEVARVAEVEVTQEDLGLEIAYLAARNGQKPEEVAEQLVAEERLGTVAADVMRRKALEHIVENIQIEGRPEPPEIPSAVVEDGGGESQPEPAEQT